jgi:hypothetical protein
MVSVPTSLVFYEWAVNCFKVQSFDVYKYTDFIIQISIDITMIHATDGAVVAECTSSMSRVVPIDASIRTAGFMTPEQSLAGGLANKSRALVQRRNWITVDSTTNIRITLGR